MAPNSLQASAVFFYCLGAGVSTQASRFPLQASRFPPTASLSAPAGIAGGAIAGTYTTNDGTGTGVVSAHLYARKSGSGWADVGPATGGAYAFTPTGSGDAADGLYYLQLVASDAAGNASATPSGMSGIGTAAVAYNNAANSPMTHLITNGSMPGLLFPLNPNLNAWVTFAGTPVVGSGSLTIERRTSDFSAASGKGINVNRLLQQCWDITPTGGFTFGTATVAFNYNETLLGSELASEADINMVFAVDAGTVRYFTGSSMVLDTAANKITATGVDGFSTWFAGNSTASVGDSFMLF